MSCINVMVGPSGSGKSWQAKNLLNSIGLDKAIIVSRDKVRELIYGFEPDTVSKYYEDLKNFDRNEKEVSRYIDRIIKIGLQSNKTVIVDNTHLRLKYCREYEKYGVLVNYLPTDTSLELCLKRNSERVRKVPEFIIHKQYREFGELKKKFDFSSYEPDNWTKPEYDSNKQDIIIWDVDGTLADNLDLRGPFEWHKVGQDIPKFDRIYIYKLIETVISTRRKIFNYPAPYLKLVICSGRDSVCRPETEKWLKKYNLEYDILLMRAENDNRADYIIKLEFWKKLSETYNIICCIDDRNQVIDSGRQAKIPMWQVDYGDF